MSYTQHQREDDTLKRVEDQINILSQFLEHGRAQLRFPGRLEQRYLHDRNQCFIEIDRRILVAGLFFIWLFSGLIFIWVVQAERLFLVCAPLCSCRPVSCIGGYLYLPYMIMQL